jgi:protein-disulfide isomerase
MLLFALALVIGLPACASGEATAGNDATAAKGGEIAAYAGDTPITMAEVEEALSAQLRELRQQEYEMRRDAVRSIVLERMVDDMAAAEGIPREQLLEREIRARVQAATDDEVRAIYEQYKTQPALQGKSFEEARPIILPQLERQKLQQAQVEYVEGLLEQANIRFLLDPPRVDLALPAEAPSKGPADAPVTLVEYSDFQCGFCKRAHPMIETLLDEYGDKVRFVYRDYWIPNHTRAQASAEAAMCAGDQDRYWEYFDNLMEQSGSLDDADLTKRAVDLGLDTEAFQACLDSDRHIPTIDASFQQAESLGVSGTPTFFINGRMLVGAKPIEEFRRIIDEELALASKS